RSHLHHAPETRLGHAVDRSGRLQATGRRARRDRPVHALPRLPDVCARGHPDAGISDVRRRRLSPVRRRQHHGGGHRAVVLLARAWVLAFAIAPPFLSETGAIVAALATACFPPFPYFGALVVTELWATFLLTASLWMTLRARATTSLWRALIAGFLVAATALTRPAFILLPFALFGMAMLVDRFRTWKLWLAAIVMMGLSVAPWFAYNYTYLGRFTLSPAGGVGRAIW